MKPADYKRTLDQLDDIGFRMELGYKRGLRLMRVGMVFTALALPLIFLPDLYGFVAWAVCLVIGGVITLVGGRICKKTSRTFRREMALLEGKTGI